MEIIEIGSRPNPTMIVQCTVCGTVVKCNYNELTENGTDFYMHCPVCGLMRRAESKHIYMYKEDNND